MIEQTVPFPVLLHGLARCVREWLLPHLLDPMARGQAEQLAVLLETLPATYGAAAGAAIRADNVAAAAVLARLGTAIPATSAASVDELMQENFALKTRLEALATAARAGGDSAALAVLQGFFRESLARETSSAAGAPDFAAITADDAKRRTT